MTCWHETKPASCASAWKSAWMASIRASRRREARTSARNSSENSPEIKYLQDRRRQLGGYLPLREVPAPSFQAPPLEYFAEYLAGSKGRSVSTTMAFVSMLRHMLKHPELGKLIVPIIPDEARTFGMESIKIGR